MQNSPSTVSIRPATSQDVGPLLLLLRSEHLPTEGVGEHVATFLVAEDAGHVIGGMGLEEFRTIDRRSVSGPITQSAEFTGACPESAVCMERVL